MDESEREHFRQQLQARERDLQDFAYAVAHDLTASVQHMMFFASDLQERLGTRLADDELDDFQRLLASSEHLQALIAELLRYARIVSHPLRVEHCSASEAWTAARELLQGPLRSAAAEVKLGPLPVLSMGLAPLTQIFVALLDNALKFRSGQRPLLIEVRALEAGPWVILEVEDNGIGIAAAHHNEVFTIFKRLHSKRAYPGYGMGLALAKRLVKHHGGDIWVDSDGHSGSTFSLRLPSGEGACSHRGLGRPASACLPWPTDPQLLS